ncbi:MAG: methionyl-tRNA formyltransferase, partial [Pseudomonadota bacterium]
IQRAIAAGDTVTGIGIMAMDAGLDTGALWRNLPVPIEPDDTGGTLHDRLSECGAQALVDALPDIFAGVEPVAQDPALVTYAKKLSKAEATLDFTRDAAALANQVRAFVPWPVAQTTLDGKQLRVWAAAAVEEAPGGRPGEILSLADGVLVACGAGALRLTRVQPAGKRQMDATDFARDRLQPGQVLGADEAPS